MAGEELTNRVKQLRFENDRMTQQQLAEQVGVTRQTIITIEANRYSPSLKLAFRIARAFAVSIDDVFQSSLPSADPATEKHGKNK
ncbi:MAG: helix-turn-helix transcriptional regulator [Planctomycetaceae bacterium]|jgi:putative transcriptional regulator|nr:helix-turn-helix transcriptional regulator [Planctomycetaceae bacterium]MBT6487350.1 helix-turn-helix transcriptional regulator [Planctomycetaceae bacterium]MBT6493064.1 helix-turn-helix transcriptional regulator [Planctomycetaceae bacterium]